MTKLHIPYLEFYITNVCNFNCNGCNRFNNYAFSGSQRWKDYAEIYKAWSEKITFDDCTILGGEPMVVSDYMEWIQNIRELWPDAHVQFLTNGSLLKANNRRLYNLILEHKKNITLSIGLHNRSRVDDVLDTVSSWLVGNIEVTRVPTDLYEIENAQKNWIWSYEKIRDPSWPDCDTWEKWNTLPNYVKEECSLLHDFNPDKFAHRLRNYCLTDSQGVSTIVSWEADFHQGALIADADTGKFRLHQSDPEKAHAICHSKNCHHFAHGKLYKCGQVALFPEFYQQFFLELSDEELHIMNNYLPASITMDQKDLKKWIDGLNDPIAQCRFCPESYKIKEIFSKKEKIIFPKKR